MYQRQGRRSVLTPAGKILLDEGRTILLATRHLAEKAKEIATGWEPKLRIALESTSDYSRFFKVLNDFLTEHETLEIDICESVLNGGWEALEHDRVDLVVGAPGPVPLQKGFRAVSMPCSPLIPVIAAHHPLARWARDPERINELLPDIRRVVTHDTAQTSIARNAGFSLGRRLFYVQTMDQKIEAQLAGLGVGHLPQHRIQAYLDSGQLVQLAITQPEHENFIAWKISHKGKALSALVEKLLAGRHLKALG